MYLRVVLMCTMISARNACTVSPLPFYWFRFKKLMRDDRTSRSSRRSPACRSDIATHRKAVKSAPEKLHGRQRLISAFFWPFSCSKRWAALTLCCTAGCLYHNCDRASLTRTSASQCRTPFLLWRSVALLSFHTPSSASYLYCSSSWPKTSRPARQIALSMTRTATK
jgi:hypothetical protein